MPIFANVYPASSPMAPAPIMTMLLGTRSKAERLGARPHVAADLQPGIGSVAGTEPVAITIFSALMTSWPLPVSTVTVCRSVIRPVPRTSLILFLRRSPSTPPVRVFTMASLRSSSRGYRACSP